MEESWFLWQLASWLVKLENREAAPHYITSRSEQVCLALPGKSEPGFPGNKVWLALASLSGLHSLSIHPPRRREACSTFLLPNPLDQYTMGNVPLMAPSGRPQTLISTTSFLITCTEMEDGANGSYANVARLASRVKPHVSC